MGRVSLTRVAVVFLIALGPQLSVGQEEPSTGPAFGRLKIDGEHIERLILRDERDRAVPFDHPGGSVELPVGTYRVTEIVLDGGYTSQDSQLGSVEIREGEEAVLRAGAPLRHGVDARRQGRYLILGYALCGREGERYVDRNWTHPPRFVIRKDGRQIASGRFEYG